MARKNTKNKENFTQQIFLRIIDLFYEIAIFWK